MPRKTLGATSPPLPAREPVAPIVGRNRVLLAILLPLAAALLLGIITGALFQRGEVASASAAPLFAALGLASWFLGLKLYGLRGMALRGGRPLFAGIGFAVLAWVVALIGRYMLVEIVAIRSAGSGRAFAYLLLFEAFAVQLWAFGLVFRALADYRGGLTAAIVSGLLFGLVGFTLFGESFVAGMDVSVLSGLTSLLYFLLWGVLYGIIRLRTGSILGTILVQALQTFTVWFVFQPPDDLKIAGLQTCFLATGLLFLIIIWRLWPRQETDYRI